MRIPVLIQERGGHVQVDIPQLGVEEYVGEDKKEALEAAIAAAILEVGIRVSDGRIHVQDAYVIEFDVQDAAQLKRPELLN